MKKVAVVTVTYNTPKDTTKFLQSVEKLHRSDFDMEVFVIDNGSKEIYTLPSHLEIKQISLERSETNLGFSGGYNIGVKAAMKNNADYIMIANNDTIADPNLLKELIKVIESDEKIGIVVPKIYFARGHEFHKDRYKQEDLGKVIWYAGGFNDWDNITTIHRGVDEVDHGQYDKTEPVDFASGCCMMFRREALESVGLLDDTYFLYYEDADLNQRMKQAGYKIFYAPKAVLVHVNAASSGGAGNGNTLQDYFITRNRMIYGMRYAPIRAKIALVRESIRLLSSGRPFQKLAIQDYYLRKFNKGTFFDKN